MTNNGRGLRRAIGVIVTGALVVPALPVAAAQASYSGSNGKIIYQYIPTLGNAAPGPFTVSPDDPGSARMLTKIDAEAYNFEYSPDGKRIAFEAAVPDSQIFVMDAKGKKAFSVTRKVDECNSETFPTWSPTGKQIAFQCDRAKGFVEHDIYSVKIVKKKKGKGKRKRTVLEGKAPKRITDTEDAYHPFWSPLGDRIAYVTYGNAIWMVPAGGGTETIVAADDSEPGIAGGWTAIDWHPNGSVLAADGLAGVYLMDPNNGQLLSDTPAVRDVTDPFFSPDGTELAYTTLVGDSAPDIGATNLLTGASRLISTQSGDERTPSWQPLR